MKRIVQSLLSLSVAVLLVAPPGRKASVWRAQAAALLMEALRDGQWITFDQRPGSLRSWH